MNRRSSAWGNDSMGRPTGVEGRSPGRSAARRRRRVATAVAAFLVAAPAGAIGQDVEELGRRHGVRPPEAYFERIRRDPEAFQFRRAWKEEARRVRETRRALFEAGDLSTLNAHILEGRVSPRMGQAYQTALTGQFAVPVLAGFFDDSTQVFTPSVSDLQFALFGDGPGPPYSVHTYYAEVSSGLVDVTGGTIGWMRADSASTWYEGSDNGLGSDAHVRDLIREMVRKADAAGFDFRPFDRDGDGYIDVLAVVHPLQDGACGSTHVWAHRSAIYPPEPTNDGVSVYDYIIQSAVGGPGGCDDTAVMPIGTFAHELGHGFDLPDLYDTSRSGEGIGEWGLMGSGGWNRQTSPAHLMAWSKDRLGWIAIDTIRAGTVPSSATLPPVVTTPLALRMQSMNDDDTYFLLENRQRMGSDAYLRGTGLLVWHVDEAAWLDHRNNAQPYGVALEQADGLRNLENHQNRGDAGDPYPGSTGKTAYTDSTVPNSRNNDGTDSRIRITGISQSGQAVTFVYASSAPDFAVFGPEPFPVAPDTVAPGDTVRAESTWTVRNDGNAVAPPNRTGFYVSPDSLITPSDRLVGTSHVPGIAPGEGSVRTDSYWVVPTDLTAGTHFVGIFVDDTLGITELNEANNFLSSRVHVQVVDLAFASSPFPLDTTAAHPGGVVRGTTWAIGNTGSSNSGPFAVRYYLSRDSLITTADLALGGGDVTGLPAGSAVSFPAPEWPIPDTVSWGNWYVGLLLDAMGTVPETDEGNNYLSAPLVIGGPLDGTITVRAGPDLETDVRPGGDLAIPILVDMSGANGLVLASLSVEINWDPARLTYETTTAGDFGTLTLNATEASGGKLVASLFSPTGTTQDFTVLHLALTAAAIEGLTDVTLTVTAAGAEGGQDITANTTGATLSVCVGDDGLWGDVTADGAVNIIDAQQIARHSVGLGTADPDRLGTHGDVTGDGIVNIVDAQQIARFAVGLPTSGRAGDLVFGGCQ